jgi:[ribosomal protein S5]-alanine N-acetyltransferase
MPDDRPLSPIPPAPPVLETARLVLRPFALTDAADVRRLAGDFAVADTTLLIPYPYPEGAAEEWIATHEPKFASGEQVICAITLRADGALIGGIGLGVVRPHARAALGYWTGVPYWGCGYCTEAARALVGYGFTVLGLERIEAEHFARNPASGRVMQKLGMRREGTLRARHIKWGRPEDSVVYSVLRGEWAAVTS